MLAEIYHQMFERFWVTNLFYKSNSAQINIEEKGEKRIDDIYSEMLTNGIRGQRKGNLIPWMLNKKN